MSRRRATDRERQFTVIPGEGKPERRGKAFVFYLILALVLVLVLQTGYHWVSAQVLAQRLQVVAAEPGYMDSSIELEGYIVREEKVVYSPCSGVVLEMHPDGERVSSGTPLVTLAVMSPAEIASLSESEAEPEGWWDEVIGFFHHWLGGEAEEETEESLPLFSGEIPPWHSEREVVPAPEAGLLSYHLDGWENLNGETMLALGRSEALPEPSRLVKGAVVKAGQPLFKIVDNWHWNYHAVLPLDPGRTAAAQETVHITFDFAPDKPVRAELQDAQLDAAAGEVRLHYLLEHQLPGFEAARRAQAVISFQRQKGLIIPAAALLTQDGQAGVYLNSGGTVIFAPVTVLRLQDEKALVEGLEPYAMVISAPELVREGQRLN